MGVFKRIAVGLLLAGQIGVAHGADLQTVRFAWAWPSPDFTMIPIVVANAKGFYQAEGVKTEIIMPPDSQTTGRLLAVGQADIGFEATTDVVFGADQGVPIVSVGVFAQHNNWGLFGRPGEPVSLGNLKGKSIGVFADSWTKAMMPFVYKAAGITENDVQLITAQDSDTPLLLAGKIDIATNASNFIVPTIKLQLNKEPTSLIGPECGVPDVPLSAYTASKDFVDQHADLGRRWMRATMRATEWAMEHPDEAADLFSQAYPNSDSREFNKLGWAATIPLLSGPSGLMVQTDRHWLPIAQALKDTGQLKSIQSADKYYTNAFLN
ncbi:hypothetical protein EOA27_09535 [Mesorhizobium sp. M2A.F.Ca.ET.037.01.1.1]|uniref:ABC transporter substrate-binding protein n=1 Tax=unclassified Mesorhizobium TaxID=325217 RepID=UPI000FCC1E3E|nr:MULTISPECIES: ABC transporter substrate-binding protein [unclassified Mesorhizobium]RUX20069.1 hypothetical protein EOA27_09535 [Mesorhizobium sp. M2A.F.Ca.ET.037.01.1.1]RUY12696.1 hypothetical protein EOA25_02550 [Mesorhizobium sp. M2A.F.Ca.ET.040.01.1.1]RWA91662.1 MAG: hypothetical protein EOQ31_11160 [Mesorhizobium sp.]TIV16911.1 MAG: ABC transporter substrate-binding protein [Mesorhizobium sp.]